ncbi:hypothetical protein BDK51DRAFT_39616 [Blyttiomyces helicus]|uniref:Uncharacterized protein n=1 Tax=Blyttiomyces helicus TaxID=388810 RepID=A0A4P9WBM7_9FUNG|nr:hypothetical protein BDK51DRAFT_39616 [Blyttiomyces helicus]|eukprot:RKO88578.1 hypothetical protein BDK51DRAFT_39616 [Blyttiomyces helicus]
MGRRCTLNWAAGEGEEGDEGERRFARLAASLDGVVFAHMADIEKLLAVIERCIWHLVTMPLPPRATLAIWGDAVWACRGGIHLTKLPREAFDLIIMQPLLYFSVVNLTLELGPEFPSPAAVAVIIKQASDRLHEMRGNRSEVKILTDRDQELDGLKHMRILTDWEEIFPFSYLIWDEMEEDWTLDWAPEEQRGDEGVRRFARMATSLDGVTFTQNADSEILLAVIERMTTHLVSGTTAQGSFFLANHHPILLKLFSASQESGPPPPPPSSRES